jgi:hypothetical protein
MNVLVYVVDCLRNDHLSCYGYERETARTIDAGTTAQLKQVEYVE